MSSRTVSWGACALLLSFASGARAEDQATPAPSAGTPPPVLMEEIVIRLPRAEAAGDPTASATVVEAARFAGEAKDVAALVATAPGVAVNEYGGLGQLATVSIRGSTADGVLVLVDGLPLNTAFGGAVDLSTIPAGWIERVEILRGPEGAFFGAGALGGVVNVVTHPPVAGRWSTEATGGSFGTAALAGDVATAAGGGTLLVAAGAQRTGGQFPFLQEIPGEGPAVRWRENNQAWRAGALTRFTAPSGDGRLDGLFDLSAGRRGLPGFAVSPTPLDWQEDGRALAMVRLTGPGPGGTSLSGRLHARLDWLDVRIGDPTPVRQRGVGAGMTGLVGAGDDDGRVTLEASGSAEQVQADGLGDRVRGRAALALAGDWRLVGGRLRLAPAARAEVDGGFAGLSAKAGATYRLSQAVTARASAGRSFRAPSLAELYLQQGPVIPNPHLTPEVALAIEGGLVAEGSLGLASVDAQLTRYQDLILYQPSSLGRLVPSNAGQALASGLEVQLASAPLLGPARATLAAGWTLLDTRILSGSPTEVGRQVPYRARQRLYARVGAAPGPVAVHLEAQYVGLRYADRRNLAPIPATLQWNAGASLAIWDRLAHLHLEVRNLLDDRTLTDGLDNPLPSRMVLLSIRVGSIRAEGTP